MPVTLTIVESTTTLGIETTEVILVSASTPGPAGVGVPAGGAEGQVLAKASVTDYDTEWVDQTGGGGGASDAEDVTFTPAGGLASTDVQAALEELDSEKAAASHAHAGEDITSGTVADARIASTIARDSEVTAAISASEAGQVRDGDTAGGVLSGTYPNPGFAADMATQAELDAHVNDTADAHDASAISIADAGGDFTATDVEGALAELQADHEADEAALAAHLTDTADAHDASAVSVDSAPLVGTGADVQAVLEELDNGIADHLADTTAAHAATAISFSPAGSIAATTVQAAIEEVASEAGGGGSGEALEKSITQTAHGLAVGEWVRLDGSGNYVTAQADTEANAEVVGVVVSVGDVDTFTLCTAGYTDVLSGLTAGTAYFLDPDVAGAITDTEPSDPDISKPVLIADSATSGWVENMRGLFGGGDPPTAAAVSIADAGNDFTATDVEGALAELQADHETDAQNLADHIADAAGAHAASAISIADAGGDFTATDVEGALDELQADAEADAAALAAHLADTADAHDASAISVDSTNLVGTGAEVQAVLEELDNAIADHLADAADAHDASAISIADAGNDFAATDVEGALAELQSDHETDAQNLADHIGDTADAHDASAISFSATGGIAATDVQTAIAEVDSEKTTAAAALAAAQTEIADQKRFVEVLCSDPDTGGSALTTGNGKGWFLVPALLNGHNLVAVIAGVVDASSSGPVTAQVANETQGVDMLTTPITVDAGERTSLTAAAAVIDTANDDVATGDFIRIDVDAAGTDVFGLIVGLTFEAP